MGGWNVLQPPPQVLGGMPLDLPPQCLTFIGINTLNQFHPPPREISFRRLWLYISQVGRLTSSLDLAIGLYRDGTCTSDILMTLGPIFDSLATLCKAMNTALTLEPNIPGDQCCIVVCTTPLHAVRTTPLHAVRTTPLHAVHTTPLHAVHTTPCVPRRYTPCIPRRAYHAVTRRA